MSDNTPKREIHRLAIASDGVNKPLECRFLNGEPILTIHPDGRVTTSNRLKPDEIASTVLEMMKEQWMANPQAKLIRELNDRIKELEEKKRESPDDFDDGDAGLLKSLRESRKDYKALLLRYGARIEAQGS